MHVQVHKCVYRYMYMCMHAANSTPHTDVI